MLWQAWRRISFYLVQNPVCRRKFKLSVNLDFSRVPGKGQGKAKSTLQKISLQWKIKTTDIFSRFKVNKINKIFKMAVLVTVLLPLMRCRGDGSNIYELMFPRLTSVISSIHAMSRGKECQNFRKQSFRMRLSRSF